MPRNKRIKKKKEFIDYGDGADYNGGRSQIFRTYADHKYTTAGKHDERKDEHGFVSRCFTRKYTLPQSANVEKVTSSLSPDGMLTVEAPLIKPAIEAAVTDIPVTVGSKSGVTKK